METTGFYSRKYPAEIIQIAALDYSGKHEFCKYIQPKTNIHPKASKRIGFTLQYQTGKRVLFLNEQPIETVSEEESAVKCFARHISEPKSEQIILMGYSSDRHDKPFILDAFKRYGIQLETPLVIIDVLPFLRKLKKNTK